VGEIKRSNGRPPSQRQISKELDVSRAWPWRRSKDVAGTDRRLEMVPRESLVRHPEISRREESVEEAS
jgi:hypothetical protein